MTHLASPSVGGANKRGIWGDRIYKISYAMLAMLPAAAALFLALYYIYGPGEGYFHSDCTDTIYWANAALEGDGIFDDMYNYAALLPFSTVWIMQPLIKLLGFGMGAHKLGMAIFAFIFAGGIYFLARSVKCSPLWSSTSVFIVFMVLSCSDKLREMMWGHTIYYSLGLVLLFYLLGAGLRLVDSLEKGRRLSAVLWGCLLLGLSIGSATDGMQIIVLTLLPMLLAFVAERIFAGGEPLLSKRSLKSFSAPVIAVLGLIIGLEVLSFITHNGEISAGYAAGYSGWSEVSAWLTNAQKFINHYFSLLGVDMQKNAPLFDAESVKYFFRIALGILLLVMPIVILCFYGRLRSRGIKVMLWAHFLLTAVVMFGYICGELSAANWRLTPIVGSSVMLCVCGLRELVTDLGLFDAEAKGEQHKPDPQEAAETVEAGESDQKPVRRSISEKDTVGAVLSRVCALALAAILAASLVFADEIKKLPADYGRDNTLHRLAQFLEDEGLEYGYATFWYSQAITVISDSRVRVRNMDCNERYGVIGRHYQSSLAWYNDQEGVDEYFVLLTLKEYKTVYLTEAWQRWMDEYYLRHYEDPNDADGFRIYVFSENILESFGSDARAAQ